MPAASSMPFEVFGRSFDAHEDRFLTGLGEGFLGIFGEEYHGARRGARRCGKALGDDLCIGDGFLVEYGVSSSSSFAGSQRSTAVRSSISPSRSMSIAILTMAAPVRLPLRHWSIHNLPSWIVNSMSCMSLKYCSRWCWISSSSL